ncbi:MAG: AAA family ATPase [Bifidobacteriaceae bacterium]|jgi:MoxR-like ATPase|nr:AAA family ATPase [Bifidobacteriaceae bacterium]
MTDVLRLSAEQSYAAELAALSAADDGPRPVGWKLTPKAVLTYLMGGAAPGGTAITPKYVGQRRLIETAVATLATDRALLLMGVPGTAKSWVSEHLAAAIAGDSTLLIQCTAGTDETQIRYGWNYAELLAHGPSEAALVATPLMRAMREGALCRLEEFTRLGSDVQDTLITVLSEKVLPIPELATALPARRGFNVIATANSRDKGVNELSSALKRRFNVVVLPLPATLEEEVSIVRRRVRELADDLALPVPRGVDEQIKAVLTVFRELRSGVTADNKVTLKTPSGTLSTAEAIGTLVGGLSQAAWFADGQLGARELAAPMVGAIVKDPVQDKAVLAEYLETVLKRRRGYAQYYAELGEAL